ncbi:plasma membrane localization protein, partial [Serendipita sp. 399]
MTSIFATFAPTHVNLISACYPSSSALVASGSTCQPLPQELSRLTYYASNKGESSGKLAKLGIELEKRASSEARKARGGNARARAQLLVTISIFKAITNECKRDVGVFTRMLLSVTRDGLLCLPNDLELQARVASLFTAWATYTDGRLIGPDLRVTNDYTVVLKTFYERCTVTGKDSEHVNRMRLIGIAAMTAAVSSDAFYASPAEFSKQVAIVVPALFSSPYEAGLESVVVEATLISVDPSPNSPYLSEFQPRPVLDRRAASIHAHIDGQKGPEISDVVNACLRALRTLLGRCTGAQVAIVFDAILQSLDQHKLWSNTLVGKSYVERVIEWTQYQFRYAVPSHLVDQLLAIQDSPSPTGKHFAFVEMLTTVFNSPFPLTNLSTSDVISSLITILLRRVSIDPNDLLLQPLVECISSLGTHVYYADQIHDLAEEVVARLVNVQVNGVLGRGKGGSEKARESALKCLLGCLSGLTEAADRHAAKYKARLAEDSEVSSPDGEIGDRPPSESTSTTVRAARRNKVAPESWQETLALMCEADYGIRAMYARGLTSFVQREIKREPFVQDGASEAPPESRVKVAVDPEFKASARPSIVTSDSISRFLNAMHATIFTLATSNGSGNQASTIAAQLKQQDSLEAPSAAHIHIIPPSDTELPSPKVSPPIAIDFVIKPPSIPSSPIDQADHPPPTAISVASTLSSAPGNGDFSPPDSSRRRSRNQSVSRKLSVALNLLDGNHVGVVATPSDFAHLRYILLSAHQQVPCRAVLTGVPMLLALEQVTRKSGGDLRPGTVRAIREVICHTWIAIGYIWEAPVIVDSAKKALDSLGTSTLPEVLFIPPTQLHPQEEPVSFSDESSTSSFDTCGVVDAEVVLPALASSSGLQAITGLDRQGLFKRFTIGWSVEGALKDSVEHASSQDILRGETPFLKLSPAFMQKDNQSLASLARSTHGGVGVGDLREALGRGSVSNPALATASLSSTVERASSIVKRGDKARPEPLAISRIKSKGRAQQNE